MSLSSSRPVPPAATGLALSCVTGYVVVAAVALVAIGMSQVRALLRDLGSVCRNGHFLLPGVLQSRVVSRGLSRSRCNCVGGGRWRAGVGRGQGVA